MARPVPLAYGRTYHISTRGNNREDIFREDVNYRHLISLYARHIDPIADTFAYCLLHSHFHFLLRIKNEEGLPAPSQRFSNLFNAYARSIYLAYHRTGALFQRLFGRHEVTSEVYFQWLVVYIHRNPEKHGLVANFRDWPYSSYHAIRSVRKTRLCRDDVLDRPGGHGEFERFHQYQVEDQKVRRVLGDDDD